MALYLGNEKVKINLDNIVYCLNIPTTTISANYASLLSSDNYVLKDANGIYLTVKDGE